MDVVVIMTDLHSKRRGGVGKGEWGSGLDFQRGNTGVQVCNQNFW